MYACMVPIDIFLYSPKAMILDNSGEKVSVWLILNCVECHVLGSKNL